MDKIILGILMLRRFTVYEIRNIIKKNFKDMCSDSLGSIQAAMKKLLTAQMVIYSEYVEKSVNKKQYSITDEGRKAFSDWLATPADLSGGKNMELGKILFMGLVPAEKRLSLIDEMIGKLENELSFLQGVQAAISSQGSNEAERAIDFWKNDSEYYAGIQDATKNPDMTDNANSIGFFQVITLQFGLDSMKFHIDWLKNLREKIAGVDFGRVNILGEAL